MSVRAAWRVIRLDSASHMSRRGVATVAVPALMTPPVMKNGRVRRRDQAEHQQQPDRDHDAAVGDVEDRPEVEVDEVDDGALDEPVNAIGERAAEDHADQHLPVPRGPIPVAEQHDVEADDERDREIQPVQLGKDAEGGTVVLDVVDGDERTRPDLLSQRKMRRDDPLGDVVDQGNNSSRPSITR